MGTETAITLFDGGEFDEVSNPRFTQKMEWKTRPRIGGTTANQQVRVFQKKRQKSRRQAEGETPSAYAVG